MEHRTVRIGLVQNEVSPDADENLARTLGLARKAARQGAGIICLQELFRTPYFPQEEAADASVYAETVPGESTGVFAALSQEFGNTIIIQHDASFLNFHLLWKSVVIAEVCILQLL